MNIKILDSWLREYLQTDAIAHKIAEIMSMTSVSVERMEKKDDDFVYDIEVTTNRPDLMSVKGLALEAAVALEQANIKAKFIEKKLTSITSTVKNSTFIDIKSDNKLARRICAVVMDVTLKPSPDNIIKRLESSDIRSLNNLIDITNYIMRETGHPAHVFDYDRLITKKLIIRESKKGETLTTLDEKQYVLQGGDIVADNGEGELVDLLGIMGTKNSVITNETKRILFFIDNLEPNHVRKTSMSLGIRTEAAILNEKDLDPSVSIEAFQLGLDYFKQFADAKIVSEIIDIYPYPEKKTIINLVKNKVPAIIGFAIPEKNILSILNNLGFDVKNDKDAYIVQVPLRRAKDIQIPEDLIEEIARIYGYHNLPTQLAPLENFSTIFTDNFYWEEKVKNALKYWGFTEVYTYSMVHEELFEGEIKNALAIKNPLSQDFVYMRRTLVPSLLSVISENQTRSEIKIFELSNIYHKNINDLPDEKLMLAGVVKKPALSMFEIKGMLEQLINDLGIKDLEFIQISNTKIDLFIKSDKLGEIEILDSDLINFECSFDVILKYATLKKTYTPLAKYPPIIEDMAFLMPDDLKIGDVLKLIKNQSALIKNVSLYDKYQNIRTFRINYQHIERNLTNQDISPVREKLIKTLKAKNIILK